MDDNFEDLNKSLLEIDGMWKALRDKSKLVPIKRPVKRKDGKTFMQTFYVHPGETETDKPKKQPSEQVQINEERKNIIERIKNNVNILFEPKETFLQSMMTDLITNIEKMEKSTERIKTWIQTDPDKQEWKDELSRSNEILKDLKNYLTTHEKDYLSIQKQKGHMLEVVLASDVDLVMADRAQKRHKIVAGTSQPMSKEEAKKTISNLREEIGTDALIQLAIDNGVEWTRNEKHVGNDYMQLAMKLTKHFTNGGELRSKSTEQPLSVSDDIKQRQLEILNKKLSEVSFRGVASIMQSEFKTKIKSHFSNGSDSARKLFLLFWDRDRFLGDEPDVIENFFSYDRAQHYSAFTRKMAVDWDMAQRTQGLKTPFSIFFHEYGHMVDHGSAILGTAKNYPFLSSNDENKKKFEESIKREAKKILGENGENYKAVKRELSNKKGSMGVQDLLSGSETNKYKFEYSHDTAYWEQGDTLLHEAFAHMFQAEFYEQDREVIETYFPESFKIYKEMVGETVGRYFK